jgi:hypothetical protein
LTENIARTDPIDFTSRSRVGTSGRELGKILRQRDPERALAVFDVSIKRQGEIRNNVKARRDQSALLAYSSYPLHRLHRAVEAKQRIDEALAILKETKDYPVDRITLGSEVDTACGRSRTTKRRGRPPGERGRGYEAAARQGDASRNPIRRMTCAIPTGSPSSSKPSPAHADR